MVSISGTDEWRNTHPKAVIGLLQLSGVKNSEESLLLNDQKRKIENELVARYGELSRQELMAHPVMSAYKRYYKRFKKTYHVQLQVESIAKKGKKLPNVSPLVDANFMAEMETFILTAGHDVAKLREPIVVDVSREGDHIIQMNGTKKTIRIGDMVMRDADGISCSILYGQDNRSPITPDTDHVLYVAYVPMGISADVVESHLQKIEDNIRLFSPNLTLEQNHLYSTY